ncbi:MULTISPECIES: DUF2238 domain-containing protein [unclassified Microbacterium]|uniref:DUF2238 domain-containing protein n=1 Tax=unclassified Microbacterium TaxID=2609290 RepID=UPI00214CC5AC|nr:MULTISPECIES: DUF2238 domain-containing protein [unclassified Microbacterium]MCR2783901.1 DUF2238 domain-containing protein [Microbacterium sp. zg.B96]WIM15254.1 DUF2238 domain-containing protein [Microbacterium sp. zg-B96]
MIENFLRRPRGVAEWTADALRVVALLSVVAAAIWSTATDAGILSLALPALLVPRFLGVRAGPDIAYCATVLVAAWSNVLDLYRTIPGWDLVAHFVCTGLIAVVAYLALARFSIVTAPRDPAFRARTAFVLVTVLGLAASAVWEMIEWFGYAFITDAIFVTYQDTIGDMAIGSLGAALASTLVAYVRLERPDA